MRCPEGHPVQKGIETYSAVTIESAMVRVLKATPFRRGLRRGHQIDGDLASLS